MDKKGCNTCAASNSPLDEIPCKYCTGLNKWRSINQEQRDMQTQLTTLRAQLAYDREEAEEIVTALQEELAAEVKRREEAERALSRHNRRFPIMNGPSVPWYVMEPHGAQCQKNHSQSLERIAQRGGFDCAEAWFVVNDLPFPIGDKELWIDAGQKWKLFADKINLEFDQLTQARGQLKVLGEGILEAHKILDRSRPIAAVEIVEVIDDTPQTVTVYVCYCSICQLAREVVK